MTGFYNIEYTVVYETGPVNKKLNLIISSDLLTQKALTSTECFL